MNNSVQYATRDQRMHASFMEELHIKRRVTNVQENCGRYSQDAQSVEDRLTG